MVFGLLRFLIILLIIRVVWRVVAGMLSGAPRRPQVTRGVPLARDPVCGIFVVQARALTTGSGDSTTYFCSEACRAEYQRSGARVREAR